jgi:hypothetical protein
MRVALRAAFAALFVALIAPLALAQVKVKLEVVADGLVHPLWVAWPQDGTNRRFIAEQTGAVWIQTPDGKMSARPFIDLAHKIVPLDREFDERGLLGLAFHPKFKENGKFYVTYSAPKRTNAPRPVRLHWNNTMTISEFRVSKTNPLEADRPPSASSCSSTSRNSTTTAARWCLGRMDFSTSPWVTADSPTTRPSATPRGATART